MQIKLNELKEHPKNIIYSNKKDDEFEDLKNSIEEYGLNNAIIINNTNYILSGHRRVQAAKELNWKTIEVEVMTFGSDEDELLFLLNENKYRSKTNTEKFKEAELYEDIESKKAKERMQLGVASANVGGGSEKGDTSKIVAEKVGLKKSNYKKMKNIEKNKGLDEEINNFLDEVIDDSRKGGVDTALKISKMNQEKQKKVLTGIVKDGKKLKDVEREILKEDLEEKVLETGDRKYRIIYADPPWKYNDKLPDGYGGADNHYITMDIPSLCLMPIKDISADNAVLFMWTTSPFLEESFKVVNAWGFKYKSSFIWDKVKHNMGHYNSVRHEILLICTKGSCVPDNRKLYDSVQSIERTKTHSEKPKEFMEIIETLYTYGNKIELFCRNKKDNWDVFGNQEIN